MDYDRLCEYYERLEATTKRLEMTDILVELLKESPSDIRPVVYLTRGQLAADFVGLELGVADKLVIRALVQITGLSDEEVTKGYHKTGDLGDTAFELLSTKGKRRKQATLFEVAATTSPLTISEVFDKLHAIANAHGSGSQGEKMAMLTKLLQDASPRAARYLVRTVTGKLRLGIADMTLLDALAGAFATKEYKPDLERAYNVSSDLGLVAETLVKEGLEGVERLHLTVGVPVRAMLAERLPTPEDILAKLGGEALVELKYDGLRLQAHIPRSGPVRFYSRRLEDLTPQFPDVAEALRAAFQGKEAIVEGEVVAIDQLTGEMRPFQDTALRRGRKKDLAQLIESMPVTLFLFDALLVDGEDLTTKPLPDRRGALERSFGVSDTIAFTRAQRVTKPEELMAFFDRSVAEGAEGIMAKSVQADSTYRAGARGWQWIKYKRDYQSELQDTLDLVVVGALVGRGRRAGWYGALLMAAYNTEEDVFESVCKLGTGFNDEMLQSLTDELKQTVHEGGPHPRVRPGLDCDVWFVPTKVLEVVGAELTLSPNHRAGWGVLKADAGLAVRFPRFTGKFRDDKKPEQATGIDELVSMFKLQGKKQVSDDPE
ncbi:MAG TPA: ATP-dependent DNA ligase [Candidatus Thermoplasmatota archaeon]|nr:ATP-dependent DNA ligase [Candidatus Thermoplasmatota archaeon]